MGSPNQTFTYDTFNFPFARLNMQSGVLYAADGFTKIGRRYIFTITGWVGGVSQADLTTKILQMQAVLKNPRKTLTISYYGDGGSTLFSYVAGQYPVTIGSDIDWGPKPGELNITRFTGGRAAMYVWTVTVNTMDSTISSDVLAVTFQWSHSVDPSGFSTRTVSGKLLLASNVIFAQKQSADYYRNVIVQAVPVTLYFKRELMEFTQSEDGRILSFSITDVEQLNTLPRPITAGHVSWMSRLHGYGEGSQLSVDYVLAGWFESSIAHGKNEMWGAVMNLTLAKFAPVIASGQVIFTERILREDVYGRNRIDFSISATVVGGALTTSNQIPGDGNAEVAAQIDLSVGLDTFGILPPGSDGDPIRIQPYGGTDGVGSGSYALAPLDHGSPYDADPQSAVTPSGGLQLESGAPPQNLQPPDPTGGNVPPSGGDPGPVGSGISDDHKKNAYVAFHEVLNYHFDNGLVRLTPKVAGEAPIIQQVRNPTLTVTQAGYSIQIGKKDDVLSFAQPPYYPWPITESYVNLTNADPISDGIHMAYKTEWRYVFLCDQVLDSNGDSAIVLPLDPRRPDITPKSVTMQQMPFGNQNSLPAGAPSIIADPKP
jgi:hypothetical protein